MPTGTGATLTERLTGQLRRAGAYDVRVADDLDELAALVGAATGPVIVSGADLVAHTAVLRHLATSPVGPTVALVLTDPPGAGHAVVREERGQVVDAGPPDRLDDTSTGVFGGALRIGVDDLPALAAAARAAAAGVLPVGTAAVGTPPAGPAVDRLFAALTALGTLTFAHRVRLLVARRVTDRAGLAAAEAALGGVDEDAAELRLSVKERDDFFATFLVSTWSPHLVRAAARIGLGPTAITVLSVLFAVTAAVLFGIGGRSALVGGAVLLYLGFVLDCVDGQLARYTRDFSAWGGWLDTMADRAKEYLVYAGLGFGATHAGLGNGWAVAIAAMTLQTVRHMTDTWYGALHDEAAHRPARTGGVAGVGGRLNAASTRVQADPGSVSYWLKRTAAFPIGERWALIALTAALFNPMVSLVAVLVCGTLAFAYTGALRTLRARWMWVPVLETVDATLHRDDGPLVRAGSVRLRAWWASTSLRRALGPPRPMPAAALAVVAVVALLALALVGPGTAVPAGRWPARSWCWSAPAGRPGWRTAGHLDWLVPAALRAAEYLFAIAVGVLGDVPPWLIFGYVFVLTLHHYDLTARLEKRQPAPPLHDAMLGWDGRSALLAVASFVGSARIGMATLGTYLLVVFVGSVVLAWVVLPARAPRTPGVPAGGGGRSPA
ncbi:CDP-alcohol phosphatidyltransferase family protein [Micromonospora sp. ATA32]|nr:CDP-alcohol phosphatidyltransferase family protein [Micromonospora sp. ATA32]